MPSLKILNRREDLTGEIVKSLRALNISMNTTTYMYNGYTYTEIMYGVKMYIEGSDISSNKFRDTIEKLGFDADQLNRLPVAPQIIQKNNSWFLRNGVNPLALVAFALRLEGLNDGSDLVSKLPFDDVVVKVTEKKVFFTYYYGDYCVTISDEPVEQFPTPAFLAVLRVAMDGLK